MSKPIRTTTRAATTATVVRRPAPTATPALHHLPRATPHRTDHVAQRRAVHRRQYSSDTRQSPTMTTTFRWSIRPICPKPPTTTHRDRVPNRAMMMMTAIMPHHQPRRIMYSHSSPRRPSPIRNRRRTIRIGEMSITRRPRVVRM